MAGRYVPDVGDIVWLNFTPQSGHEQAGRCPAVVLSPKAYNQKSGLLVCVPITQQIKGYPFEVVSPIQAWLDQAHNDKRPPPDSQGEYAAVRTLSPGWYAQHTLLCLAINTARN